MARRKQRAEREPAHSWQPARFWAIDLHVHTPASADVLKDRYGADTPTEVVEAALRAGLDAIAITDHNTVEWCDDVAKAAEGTALTVLPGAEIATSEGHVLAIWEVGTDPDHIRDVLTKLDIDRKQQGKVEVSSPKGVSEVAKEIARSGGLAIAAHIDRDRGMLKIQSADHLRRALSTPELSALEIVEREAEDLVKRKLKGGSCGAFVQNSDVYPAGGDSHVLSAIGRRRTWIKASRPDLVGIRHALQDPGLRVRLDEPERPLHCWIRSLRVRGGFLDGFEFNFSSDLNCLVGGTGSGKSLTLELIRFALDDQTDAENFEKVRDEVDRRLSAALGTDASVEVILTQNSDDLVVRRVYDEAGSPPPEVLSTHGETERISRSKIRAFSQGEVIEYAREPVGRLQLIDASLDLEETETAIREIRTALDDNGQQLWEITRRIAQAEEQLKDLEETRARVKELSALFKADVVKQQGAWTKEELRFGELAELIDDPEDLSLQTSARFSHSVEITDNADLYQRAKGVIQTYVKAIKSLNRELEKTRGKALRELRRISQEWERRFNKFEQELSLELSKVDNGGDDLQVLRLRLRQLQQEKERLEDVKRSLGKSHHPRKAELLKEREILIDRLVAARHARRDLRRERVKSLNKAMDGAVRISLLEESEAKTFAGDLARLAKGSRLSQTHLKQLAERASPIRLVRSLLEADYAAIEQATGVPQARIQALFDNAVERGRMDELLSIQAVEVSDALRVQFRKPGTDTYTDIEDLAHGEKCTAILIIAMAEGIEPLIIDQPEDALHAPWIEDHLVRRLRELRGRRQYLFATRSPGIVASADAEMIIALGGTAGRGELLNSGSLERHDLNERALYHLEGGAEPFQRRADKFSVSLEQRGDDSP